MEDTMKGIERDLSLFRQGVMERFDAIEQRIPAVIEEEEPLHVPTSKVSDAKLYCSWEDLYRETTNIIESLVWQSTMNDMVCYIGKKFVDSGTRERFVRCAMEMVLEKDKQYRKCVGSLLNHLLVKGVVSNTSVLSVLSSILLMIESSVHYDTKIWGHLMDIVLPVVFEGNMRLLTIKRTAQKILNDSYCNRFIAYLADSVEKSGNCSGLEILDVKHKARKSDVKYVTHNIEDKIGLKNNYSTDDEFEKIKIKIEEVIGELLNSSTMDSSIVTIKEMLKSIDSQLLLDQMVDIALRKSCAHRRMTANFLVKLIMKNIIVFEELKTVLCVHLRRMDNLIKTALSRRYTCSSFMDIISPLMVAGLLDVKQLLEMAGCNLCDVSFSEFGFFVRIAAQSYIPLNAYQNANVTNDATGPAVYWQGYNGDVYNPYNVQQVPTTHGNRLPERESGMEFANPNQQIPYGMYNEQEATDEEEIYRQQQLQAGEFQQNIGQTSMMMPIEESGDASKNVTDSKPESKLKNIVEAEALPSGSIKDMVKTIIEDMMQSKDIVKSANNVVSSFSKFQIDVVFKAILSYCKDKSREYRINVGYMCAELANIYGQKLISYITNTLSLELGDFTDFDEFWFSLAEVIAPMIIKEKFNFLELKNLPKYLLPSVSCGHFILAIFKTIIIEKDAMWLKKVWMEANLRLEDFIPLESIHEFLTKNQLQFCATDEDLKYYKEKASSK